MLPLDATSVISRKGVVECVYMFELIVMRCVCYDSDALMIMSARKNAGSYLFEPVQSALPKGSLKDGIAHEKAKMRLTESE